MRLKMALSLVFDLCDIYHLFFAGKNGKLIDVTRSNPKKEFDRLALDWNPKLNGQRSYTTVMIADFDAHGNRLFSLASVPVRAATIRLENQL